MDDGILDLLRRVSSAGTELRLLNIYQGIPIAYNATIIYVGTASITVKTEKFQIVCLFQERETFIQYPGFPSIIHARVGRIEPTTLQAELGEFEYIQNGIGDRRQVRVWPKEAITGQLSLSDRIENIKGELADISLEGIGIYLNEGDYYSQMFRQGRKVSIVFRIPGVYQLAQTKKYESGYGQDSDRYDRSSLRLSNIHTPTSTGDYDQSGGPKVIHSPEVEVTGTVSNMYIEANTRRCRLGVKLLPNEMYRTLVSQFVSQRQSEIIQEINMIYRMLTREQS